MNRRVAGLAGLAVLAVVAAGCGGGDAGRSAPSASSSAGSAPATSAGSAPSSSASVSVAASPGGGPAEVTPGGSASQTPLASATGPVPSLSPAAEDPSLLAILPPTVGGRAITETPDAEHGSVADPAIARAAARLAMGYVSSASGSDWAIVSIVALRPGVWSDGFFRDWRDTYDASLCEPQGGVGGHAVATIGGREVDIASCGSLRTYHVHLPGPDVVLSVAAVGEARFGELVMAGLRP